MTSPNRDDLEIWRDVLPVDGTSSVWTYMYGRNFRSSIPRGDLGVRLAHQRPLPAQRNAQRRRHNRASSRDTDEPMEHFGVAGRIKG